MSVSWIHRHNENGEEICCCPECDAPADPKLTYCTVCGYDIVEQIKVDLTTMRPVVY